MPVNCGSDTCQSINKSINITCGIVVPMIFFVVLVGVKNYDILPNDF